MSLVNRDLQAQLDKQFRDAVLGPPKKYWLEAGTILYFEKQPNKSHIPRRGEYFTSIAVYRAAEIDGPEPEVQDKPVLRDPADDRQD